MSNLLMEMSDFSWQHHKYARPEIFVVTLLWTTQASGLQAFGRYRDYDLIFKKSAGKEFYHMKISILLLSKSVT